jgi:thiamine pyrophosphate-dependent acetolactate synthase large subunit-like protein
MPSQRPRHHLDRRTFVTGAVVAGAALPDQAAAVQALGGEASFPVKSAQRPSARVAAAEAATPKAMAQAAGPAGSDFMVDVIKSLGVKYILSNPASSFRGLHESLINYGGNKDPEFITCMHEESSVAMAHGYFKITGKPLVVLCHGTVGLQHAAMAIYNAWCDRAPVIVVGGNDLDATKRAPGVPTYHSAVDIGALVRDFTKWDDNPVSLPHFAESFVRAYKVAMTPPYEPVFLSLDAELQEETAHHPEKLRIPRYAPTAPPQGDMAAVREAAKLLANAQNPVIVADRAARTPNGIALLVELAELLNAPVVDQRGRMNFPNTHYLSHTGRAAALLGAADVVLGLELADFWATVNAYIDNGENLREPRVKDSVRLISIGALDYYLKANYQDFQRYQPVDLSIAGDAEATLPSLIEAVRREIPNERKDAIARRGESMRKAWADGRERTRVAAAYAWDESPISTARLCAEVWNAIKGNDWSMVGADRQMSNWASRLWPMEKHYHHLGGPGGFGVGYNIPAAVGAALANRAEGRLSVNLQPDGDMMYAPGVLWTAAHHNIPLLTVMHNNRGYHQEVMHVQRIANRRNRVANLGKDTAPVGTGIQNPNIDYAKLAASMGWWSAGPVSDPAELAPVLKKAVEVVKAGEPALVDVVTQPR